MARQTRARGLRALPAVAGSAAVIAAAGLAIAAPGAQAATAAPASTPCTVSVSAPDCQSTDPALTVAAVFGSNSTACTFDYSVDWGDGTTVQQVTFKGLASGQTNVASHTYHETGQTYTVTASVVQVKGGCTPVTGNYKFTLESSGATGSTSSPTPAPSASATGASTTTSATPGASASTQAGTATSAAPTATASTPAGAPATGGGTGPGPSATLAAVGGAIVIAGAVLIFLYRRRHRRSA